MMRRHVVAAACFVLLTGLLPWSGGGLGPTNAVAEDGEDMQKAREFFKKGKKAYSAEKYGKAAEFFEKAYEFSDRTALLFNIGQAYRKAGELKQAEKFFQKYLNKRPNADNSDEVVQKVIRIQEELAAKMGSVKVETARKGQNVFINDEGERRCQTPCSVSLVPGTHTLYVRAEGFLEASRELEVEKTTDETVELELTPEDAVGYLYVETAESGGSVQIEGEEEQSLPMESPVQLRKGSHSVTVTGPSGNDWSGDVGVPGGETTRLMIPIGEMGGGGGVVTPIAAGLAGASAALLTGGAVIGNSAKQTNQSIANSAGRPAPGWVASGRRDQRTANILFAAGATTLAASAGLFTWKLVAGGGSGGSDSESEEVYYTTDSSGDDEAEDDGDSENDDGSEEASDSNGSDEEDDKDDQASASSSDESEASEKEGEEGTEGDDETEDDDSADSSDESNDEEDDGEKESPEGTPDTLAPVDS